MNRTYSFTIPAFNRLFFIFDLWTKCHLSFAIFVTTLGQSLQLSLIGTLLGKGLLVFEASGLPTFSPAAAGLPSCCSLKTYGGRLVGAREENWYVIIGSVFQGRLIPSSCALSESVVEAFAWSSLSWLSSDAFSLCFIEKQRRQRGRRWG